MNKHVLLIIFTLVTQIIRNADADIVIQAPFVPIDRLISEVETYIGWNPDDAHGYYALGRIHYFAFINRLPFVAVFSNPGLWSFAGESRQRALPSVMRVMEAENRALNEVGYRSVKELPEDERDRYRQTFQENLRNLEDEGWEPERISDSELHDHIISAAVNLKRALELDPENAQYHLAFANFHEQYASYLRENSQAPPVEIRELPAEDIRDAYYKAYEISIREDREKRNVEPEGGWGGFTRYRAGKGFVRMVESENLFELNIRDWWRYIQVKLYLWRFDRLRKRGITRS